MTFAVRSRLYSKSYFQLKIMGSLVIHYGFGNLVEFVVQYKDCTYVYVWMRWFKDQGDARL